MTTTVYPTLLIDNSYNSTKKMAGTCAFIMSFRHHFNIQKIVFGHFDGHQSDYRPKEVLLVSAEQSACGVVPRGLRRVRVEDCGRATGGCGLRGGPGCGGSGVRYMGKASGVRSAQEARHLTVP